MGNKVSEAAAGAEKKAWYKVVGSGILGVLRSTWELFSSVKLIVFVLIILALTSIIGTVIEQNQPVDTYVTDYGEKWANVILALRLNDMYHSFWFTGLLGVMTLNIVVCTIERFPPKWRTLLAPPKEFDPAVVDRFRNNAGFTVDADVDTAGDGLVGVLKSKGYKVRAFRGKGGEGGGGGGERSVYAWKGLIGRFGSDFVHLSLLLILIGAIVGSYKGFRDFKGIYVGTTIDVPNAEFKLRLDKFWIEYYDTGEIRQYNSLLTVIDGGEEVLTKQIWVNEPLYYKGIRFYQSSWGLAWDRIKDAEIALAKSGEDDRLYREGDLVNVGWMELEEIPGTPYSIKLVGYVSDFAYDEKSKSVFSKSGEADNPAVRVEVYEDGTLVAVPWLFFNYPGLFSTIGETDYNLVLNAFNGVHYSGISLNKDPGTNIVWVGTGIMSFGFILAFFVFHRRIWVTINRSDRSTLVRVGGTINKNNLAFEKEFGELMEALKATSAPGTEVTE
ncbi:MAG: cytochrome c biogenesis protein ResB [Thermodesulfobacteriota bacterium]